MRRLILLAMLAAFATACTSTRSQPVKCETFTKMMSDPSPSVDPVERSCPLPPGSPAYPFENLVFQGGGVKGIAYVGSLKVLEQQGILADIKRLAGTSAGAITATLMAVGVSPDEFENLMANLPFEKFEDDGSDLRVLEHYGYYKGDYFLDLMRCLINFKTRDDPPPVPQPTLDFEALDKRGIELRLFTTDLTTGEIAELSGRATPELEVAMAARMSMSIPLFFAAVEPQDGPRSGHIFVDGGVLDNYPINTFDRTPENRYGQPRQDTLGFTLLSPTQGEETAIDDILEYIEQLAETVLNVQVDELLIDGTNLARTVAIDDLDVPTTKFDLSPATKRALVESGAHCTCSFLDAWRAHFQQIDALLATPIAPAKAESVCGWLHPGGA